VYKNESNEYIAGDARVFHSRRWPISNLFVLRRANERHGEDRAILVGVAFDQEPWRRTQSASCEESPRRAQSRVEGAASRDANFDGAEAERVLFGRTPHARHVFNLFYFFEK
jgi:hypothetical protein